MPANDRLNRQASSEPERNIGSLSGEFRPTSEEAPQLTAEQLAAFRRDGFLVVDGLTDQDEIISLRAIYDRLFLERQGWDHGDLFDMVGPDDLESGLALPQMLSPSRYAPQLRETRLCASAYALARQLFGPKVESNLEHAIMKPPDGGAATPWHQDDAFARPGWGFVESVSIWMPLQDVSVENGCMVYIRGSNHGPLYPHRSPKNDPRIHGLEMVTAPDLTDCVAAPVRAGGAVLHHSRTIHAAGPNASDGPRRAYVLGFGVRTRPSKLFVQDYPWNREKITAREQRQLRSMAPFKRLSHRIVQRLRGHV